MPGTTLLETRTIVKIFDHLPVLRGVSINIEAGEILCLLGPSGCGKSTLLRVIAGLERADSGSVLLEDQSIDRLPVHQRGFGFMFQDFALFPHRTVAENVAFGLRMQSQAQNAVYQRVAETLALVGLEGYGERTIYELSGGERQRVALARTLAPRPRLIMLDEPLGSLDRTLRERLSEDLRELIKSLGLTAIYVTHDQAEAFVVADRIAVMSVGNVVQVGTPYTLYHCPATSFVARFLGLNTIVSGRMVAQRDDLILVETALGQLAVQQNSCKPPQTTHVLLVIRPEAAQPASAQALNIIEGRIVRRTFQGAHERVILRHHSNMHLELNLDPAFTEGKDILRVSLRPESLSLMPAEESIGT